MNFLKKIEVHPNLSFYFCKSQGISCSITVPKIKSRELVLQILFLIFLSKKRGCFVEFIWISSEYLFKNWNDAKVCGFFIEMV